jgi:hypothetical protein
VHYLRGGGKNTSGGHNALAAAVFFWPPFFLAAVFFRPPSARTAKMEPCHAYIFITRDDVCDLKVRQAGGANSWRLNVLSISWTAHHGLTPDKKADKAAHMFLYTFRNRMYAIRIEDDGAQSDEWSVTIPLEMKEFAERFCALWVDHICYLLGKAGKTYQKEDYYTPELKQEGDSLTVALTTRKRAPQLGPEGTSAPDRHQIDQECMDVDGFQITASSHPHNAMTDAAKPVEPQFNVGDILTMYNYVVPRFSFHFAYATARKQLAEILKNGGGKLELPEDDTYVKTVYSVNENFRSVSRWEFKPMGPSGDTIKGLSKFVWERGELVCASTPPSSLPCSPRGPRRTRTSK